MRILIALCILVTSWSSVEAQNPLGVKHHRQLKTGMYTLLGWSVSNIAVGSIGALSTDDTELSAFHQFNAGWNLVNLGLAGSGLLSLRKKDFKSMDDLALYDEVNRMGKVFLFNTGLDVGYMAFGLYLRERGLTQGDLNIRGAGTSLLLQGGFLFAFDLLMYTLLNTNSKAMFNSISTLAPSDKGLGFVIRF